MMLTVRLFSSTSVYFPCSVLKESYWPEKDSITEGVSVEQKRVASRWNMTQRRTDEFVFTQAKNDSVDGAEV